jgi:hypothetical protein
MFKQDDILNKEFFLVFECIYLEDGIYPEYEFSGAFITKYDAEKHYKSLNNKFYKSINKLFKQKLDFTSNFCPLSWNHESESFTDNGCFMSVTLDDILNYLNK